LDTKEKLLAIREKLGGGVLVGDGATGALLADRRVNRAYTRANFTHGPVDRVFHEEYRPEGGRGQHRSQLEDSHPKGVLEKKPEHMVESTRPPKLRLTDPRDDQDIV
jgi:hypothetical protein